MARRRPNGDGSIYQRKDGRWVGELRIGRKANGKPDRKCVYGETQREAREKLDELKRQHASGILTAPTVTVADHLTEWRSAKARDVKPRTAELHAHYCKRHIVPAVGHLKLRDLTPLHVERLISTIADTVGKNTANKVRTLLFSAMKKAVRLRLVPFNPVEAVDPVKEQPRTMKLWTTTETDRFLSEARTHRLYAAFHLLLSTGLRRGELLGLRWSDIDGNLLHVRRSVTLRNNVEVITTPKTKRSTRVVALPHDALATLETHRQQQRVEHATVGIKLDRQTHIFTSEAGTLMGVRNFSRTFTRLQAKAGVTHIRLHDLRHLHATLLVAHGVDLRTVADRLGHADPAFTLRTYSHVLERNRVAAAIGLDELLDRQPPAKTTDRIPERLLN